jgi:large subunit ribosomal protein L30
MAEGQIHIKQVRSAIGTKPKHRGTLRALGLGRPGKTATLPDRPEIRGMLARVVHLVEVDTPADGPGTDEKPGTHEKPETHEKVVAK